MDEKKATKAKKSKFHSLLIFFLFDFAIPSKKMLRHFNIGLLILVSSFDTIEACITIAQTIVLFVWCTVNDTYF